MFRGHPVVAELVGGFHGDTSIPPGGSILMPCCFLTFGIHACSLLLGHMLMAPNLPRVLSTAVWR